MSTAFSDQFFRPVSDFCVKSRRPTSPKPAGVSFPPCRLSENGNITVKNGHSFKWALRLSLVEQSPQKSMVDANGLVEFLYEDLPHLFDDQGIDRTMYDDRVKFRDPITKHDTIDGYLFNIRLLKLLFRPDFQLHNVIQKFFCATFNCIFCIHGFDARLSFHEEQLYMYTPSWVAIDNGPYEITTRWTMVMRFVLLPWKPELVFTGVSIMGINPQTQKFCSHVDLWDSLKKNDYFSLEGLWDVFRQLRIYKTPDLESPKYQILRRTAAYEVRKYAPFVVVESKGDKLSGSAGFNDVAGYIFGKNSSMEKIPMTTPVFTQAVDSELSTISIQIVLPSEKELDNLPDPNKETVKLRKMEGGIAAALKFSGKCTEDIVLEKEKSLRSTLLRDGLKPQQGCLLARYNDPGRTWSFLMRNEVLIWLEDFTLD